MLSDGLLDLSVVAVVDVVDVVDVAADILVVVLVFLNLKVVEIRRSRF